MATTAEIDTTNLLTILGLIAAVWALISPTSKLRLRFCITWVDWIVGGAIFFLIHYLVFAPTLESIGLYYSLGPWRWGFNSSSAIYLLLLVAVIYFFWRTKSPKLARKKIRIFRELIENLLFTKRYDELVLLVEPQLPMLINLAHPSNSSPKRTWPYYWSTPRQQVQHWTQRFEETNTQAREVLLCLVTSPELTAHLAAAHPYFCLKLIEADEVVRSDFIDHLIEALLDVPGSRLYIELKNNQNLNRGKRLFLPENNRLLRFFFADAAAAIRNGLDRGIGEAVCRRLDEDEKLAEILNKPIGSYYEAGRFRCPINSGITLFEIMVHEGIHQGLQDHMWLHYFRHFTSKILEKMAYPPNEDNFQEWPTPFHYLLYRLVSITTEWAEQCGYINNLEIPESTRSGDGFDRHLISKEATKALGNILEIIIQSEKISSDFKKYLLETAIRRYARILEGKDDLKDVASSFITNVIHGTDLPRNRQYQAKLQETFLQLDHVLRENAKPFGDALSNTMHPVKK